MVYEENTSRQEEARGFGVISTSTKSYKPNGLLEVLRYCREREEVEVRILSSPGGENDGRNLILRQADFDHAVTDRPISEQAWRKILSGNDNSIKDSVNGNVYGYYSRLLFASS